MESQPQIPEFRNNPENFHPCIHSQVLGVIKILSYQDFERLSSCLFTCFLFKCILKIYCR